MPATIVVGTQWGDEGKGKFTDLFAKEMDLVVRYQGGHNAGHTVIIGQQRFVLHLVPSGILNPGKICVIGNGLVVDPTALIGEIEQLQQLGIEVTPAQVRLRKLVLDQSARGRPTRA